MEKVNFVKNGVSRLPPGFRFQPTDEEIVFQYLKSKVFSCPLPASIIPDINNVSNYDPWDLPGRKCDDEEERYFFSWKETKYRNGSRMNRTTKSGYWKATGSDKRISSSSSSSSSSCDDGLVGIRKTLVFYQGKSPHASRTHWVLHEYRLANASNSTHQSYVNEIGDWVLCRLLVKKKNNNNNNNNNNIESDGGGIGCSSSSTAHRHHMMMHNNSNNNNNARLFDFMMPSSVGKAHSSSTTTSSSSCSSSSNFMEVSSYASDRIDHENTSATYPRY